MIKTLRTVFKQDKEGFNIPKGVQDILPVRSIYEDGIFKVGANKYAKSYKFEDINYAVASRDDNGNGCMRTMQGQRKPVEQISNLPPDDFPMYRGVEDK